LEWFFMGRFRVIYYGAELLKYGLSDGFGGVG